MRQTMRTGNVSIRYSDESYIITRNNVRLGQYIGNTVTDYRGRTYTADSLADAINYFTSRRWDISRKDMSDRAARSIRKRDPYAKQRWSDN
jgi:hypothetical protein